MCESYVRHTDVRREKRREKKNKKPQLDHQSDDDLDDEEDDTAEEPPQESTEDHEGERNEEDLHGSLLDGGANLGDAADEAPHEEADIEMAPVDQPNVPVEPLHPELLDIVGVGEDEDEQSDEPPDAPETVDRYIGRHGPSPCSGCRRQASASRRRMAAAAAASAVMPNFSYSC